MKEEIANNRDKLNAVWPKVGLLALLLAFPFLVFAQCPNNNSYWLDLTPTGAGNTQTTACIWGGEYVSVGVCAGASYTFSTCASTFDTQITVYNSAGGAALAYNDDGCGLQSQVTWTAGFDGVVWVLVDNWPCSNGTTCATLSVTQNTACVSGPCTGTLITVQMLDSFGDGWNGAVYNILDANGISQANGTLPSGSIGTNTHCLEDGCYTMQVTSGTFPGEVSWNITNTGNGTFSGGAPASVSFAVGNAATGCTNPSSANYDPLAECDDGSCLDCFNDSPTGCPEIDAGADIVLPECTTPCTNVQVTADFFETGATTSYDVCGIAYSPPYPYNTGTAIFINQDDVYGDVVNLPFNFCFYGNTYSQVVVGANGLITFNTGLANQFCPWSFNAACPSPALPLNAVFGPYHDIDPSVCGSVRYAVLGAAPCRVFVVNFDNVCHFSCNSLISRSQIVLYETTNAIEVYIENKPTCVGWNSGNALVGIQNAAGTQGVTPASRQTGAWSASNEAWRFTPNGASIVEINWYSQADGFIGTGPIIDVCPEEASQTYVAEAVYSRCDGSQVVVADDVTVTCAMILMPVEWLDFQAKLVNNDRATLCTWQTASETNNEYFTVERSVDGQLWSEVGKLPGAGSSQSVLSYELVDEDPPLGISYYRVRQTDVNGETSLSRIRSVERNQSQLFGVYPNPGRNNFTLTGYQDGDLFVYDLSGRRVPFSLSMQGNLQLHQAAAGTYILELRYEYGLDSERLRLTLME